MFSQRHVAAFFLIIGFGLPATGARADDEPRFDISAGYLFSVSDTSFRLDSQELGEGTTLDLEDDLGFKSTDSIIKGAMGYRFGSTGRHRVDLAVYRLVRTSRITIDEEIQFGDEIFNIHADISGRFGTNVYKANYSYMFLKGDRTEMGASIGAFVADLSASITDLDSDVTEGESYTAPLPTLGLNASHALTDRLRLVAAGDVFFIDTKKYDGTLLDLRAGFEYRLTRWLDLGVNYNYLEMDLGVDTSSTSLEASWKVHGVFSYLKFRL